MRIRALAAAAATIVTIVSSPAASQDIAGIPQRLTVDRFACPGDPIGNLASFDCSFTPAMRGEHFVTSSVTDQAIIGAAITGLFAHLRRSPREWDQGWEGYGRRVGIRYERKLVGAAVELAAGAIMHTDPRHVPYATDPRLTMHTGGFWVRTRHALQDWAMVPVSARDAKGRRLPNLPLFLGAVANGFAGYNWVPERDATVKASLQRAAGPLSTALLGSFYAEFGPEVGRVLGSLTKRKAKTP